MLNYTLLNKVRIHENKKKQRREREKEKNKGGKEGEMRGMKAIH